MDGRKKLDEKRMDENWEHGNIYIRSFSTPPTLEGRRPSFSSSTFPVHPTRFTFCFFPGLLAISTLLSSHNNNLLMRVLIEGTLSDLITVQPANIWSKLFLSQRHFISHTKNKKPSAEKKLVSPVPCFT